MAPKLVALGVMHTVLRAGALLFLTSGWLHAQAPAHDLEEADCPRCEIKLQAVLTLGDSAGPGMLEEELSAARIDSRGRFYVSGSDFPYFWVFDSDGSSVRRVGRRGEGPGEFQRISAILVGAGDSLYVFDQSLMRMTVLSPEYEAIRIAHLGFSPDFDVAELGGHIVINANIRTPDRAGYPLHLLTPDGNVTRSFGSVDGLLRPDLPYGMRRAVAAGDIGTVWSAWLNQYVLEEWSPNTGGLLRTLTRQADWFQPYSQRQGGPHNPPPPHTRAVHQEGDTVWVLAIVPGPDWRSAIDSIIPDPSGRGDFFTVQDGNQYQHTMIEAIDLRRNHLIASSMVPRRIWGFLGPRLVYGPDVDESGNPVVGVWELEFLHP